MKSLEHVSKSRGNSTSEKGQNVGPYKKNSWTLDRKASQQYTVVSSSITGTEGQKHPSILGFKRFMVTRLCLSDECNWSEG